MIGLISDVHSNIDALEAVLDAFTARGIERVYAAGDLVGYYAAPNECCERLRTVASVRGNHDEAALFGPNYPKLHCFNPYAMIAACWSHRQLTPTNRRFLRDLPDRLRFQVAGRWVCIVHGSPRDPLYDYEFGEEATDDWLVRLLDLAEADILVMGHTHLPYVRHVGNRMVINPGSVGQPRDLDPRASCAILDPGRMQAEILRLDYDIAVAAQRIAATGLPKTAVKRLHEGW